MATTAGGSCLRKWFPFTFPFNCTYCLKNPGTARRWKPNVKARLLVASRVFLCTNWVFLCLWVKKKGGGGTNTNENEHHGYSCHSVRKGCWRKKILPSTTQVHTSMSQHAQKEQPRLGSSSEKASRNQGEGHALLHWNTNSNSCNAHLNPQSQVLHRNNGIDIKYESCPTSISTSRHFDHELMSFVLLSRYTHISYFRALHATCHWVKSFLPVTTRQVSIYCV